MRTYDVNDYGTQRRFPWLPLLVLAILVAVAATWYFTTRKGDKEITGDDDTLSTPSTLSTKQVSLQSTPSTPSTKQVSLQSTHTPAEIEEGRQLLELILSRRPMEGKIEYQIKPGDVLTSIASRYNCPVLLIQKMNGISDPRRIRAKDVIWVLDKPKFSLEISKTLNTLSLYYDGRFLKIYSVGTGTNAKTPVGTFKITDKIEKPDWDPPDGRPRIPFGNPENILGTHWMKIESTGDTPVVRGYGIHGTWDDTSVGKQSSAGCVRMLNDEVAEVYMFVPRGTPVTIREN